MSLADKVWLSALDVAAVLDWSVSKARKNIRAGTFGSVRISTDTAERVHHRVHRDEVIKFANTKKGGRHGRE